MFDENTPGAKEELFAWLRHMNKYKGSDLFITTNFPPAMKVDGKIMRLTDEPLSAEKCMEIAFSIMSSKQIEEFSSTNECNFAISLPDTSRFRVNAMVQRGATALVFRSITSNIPKFETLNLPPYSERHRPQKTRPDYFCRRYRFGQVHFPRLPYRLSKRKQLRPHYHHRRPD